MERDFKTSQKAATRARKPKKNDQTRMREEAEKTYPTPSEYARQMSLNPERIMAKNRTLDKKQSSMFTSSPRVVIFRNFSTGIVHTVTIQIQNTSEIPHQLRLVNSDSVVFNVAFKGPTLNTRLAPGMAHTYEVEFHPDEEKDYFHDIVFKTEVGCFVVPVIASGPKPVLLFPDQIDMGQTGLKVTRTKPVLMRNTGDTPTGFSIFTDSQYFAVIPAKGSIKADETIQLKFDFTPQKKGIANGHVYLQYDSGDLVRSSIYGEAVPCDVRVREDVILLKNTYLGLAKLATIEIINNSDYLIRFKWMKHKNIEEDMLEKERSKAVMEPPKTVLCKEDFSKDLQDIVSRRVYEDCIDLLMSKSLIYDNDHFTIFQMDGEVWPCKSLQVSVNFQPKTVGDIHSYAYLEIDGLEYRIPVSLIGKCLGPALELNLLSLDVQEVYLCSTYIYEVVCKNVGPIPGTLVHVHKTTDFGSTIQVKPHEIEVNVDELKCMKLYFCSNRTGCFIERIDFSIKESSELLSFVMKGKVICPLVRTDDGDDIDFHLASLGFTTKKFLGFRNLSHEPIEFSIKVACDGYEKCVTHEDFAKAHIKPRLPSCPRQFYVCPCEGTVGAKSPLRVQIFYTPNIAGAEIVKLQIDLGKSSNAEPLVVPMSVNANSALFGITPEKLKIRFCFVNFPYCRKLTVTNLSDIVGYFYIYNQEVSSDTTVLYSLSANHGVLKPQQSKEVTLTLIVKSVGEQTFYINVYSFGLEKPVICSEITCIGQGPVVSAEPSHLGWGEVRLLQEKSLTLTITNDSPISAEFTTLLNKTKDIWKIEPACGELESNESVELRVTIFLRDSGTYSDRLVVSILNGIEISVSLSAVGVGSSIVFDPEIFPVIDLGVHFCGQNVSIPIKVKNEGNRFHHILLTNEEKIRQGKKAHPVDSENTMFKIEPNVIELRPGETETIHCKVRQNTEKTITESWYINATIDGQGKREVLGSSQFTATFVEPDICFDKDKLTFRLDLGHESETLKQKDHIQVTNRCRRSVTAHVTIDPPFVLVDQCNCRTDYIDFTLANNESTDVRVYFPFDIENSETVPLKYKGYLTIAYDEHQTIDRVLCMAEVNFPHVICTPSQLEIYCVHGWSIDEKVKILNDSPLPVSYKMKLAKTTFDYQRLATMSEDGHESFVTDSCVDITVCPSVKDDDSDAIPLLSKNSKASSSYGGEEDWSESSIEVEAELVCTDLVDRFFQITPATGLIPPQSESWVIVTFNGFKRAKTSIQVICEVARGSTQSVIVNATADTVKCEIQDYSLDLGLQLYCETSLTTLRIKNQCMIPLDLNVETSTTLLKVSGGSRVLDPTSESSISIERQASAPGFFNEKLFLEVTHLEPFIIKVQWLAIIPQVYLEMLSNGEFEFGFSPMYEYQAIQLLTYEWIINQERNVIGIECSSSGSLDGDREFSDYQKIQLIDDGWQIISRDERYPSIVDIRMASERLIVKNWIEEAGCDVVFGDLSKFLHAPCYDINMNYVVVEQTKQITVPLNNYGFEKARVKLLRNAVKRKSPESCLMIQLERNVEICQCESSALCISFSPKKFIFLEKYTVVSERFFLDIKRGLRIPVSVQVSAVYPDLTVALKKLNFCKVFLGECKEMSFTCKNEEHVDCQWKVVIENESKNPTKSNDCPFYVNYSNDVFSPGQEAEIKVYYKPNGNGRQKANLKIVISDGREDKTIYLTGYGIDRKLSVQKSKIRFPTLIPNTNYGKENVILENNNDYPMTLYWKHENDFTEYNIIVRVLKHYYATDNILIPTGKMGEKLSPILIDFYNSLIRHMHSDQDFESFFDIRKATDRDSQTIDTSSCSDLHSTSEVEALLHAYIDKKQQVTNLLETMGDPLQELYENNSSDGTSSVKESLRELEQPKKKLIIIFHGASDSEYQETACRSAKALNLPLLNLNQAILETVATSTTPSGIKLAGQIDQRYNDLTSKLKKFASVALVKSTDDEEFEMIRLLRKVPPPEELESVDRYTCFETKLEVIRSIVEFVDLFGSSLLNDKSSLKSQDFTERSQSALPNVNQDVVREVLWERLAGLEFKDGYVLQTLNCDFVKNEAAAMKMLLWATGEAEIFLLVAFVDFDEEEVEVRDVEKSDKILQGYNASLNRLLEAISNWETDKVTIKETNKRTKSRKEKRDSSKNEFLAKPTEKFFVWYVRSSDADDKRSYESTIVNLSQHFKSFLRHDCGQIEEFSQPTLSSHIYSILKERATSSNSLTNGIFTLSEPKSLNERRSTAPNKAIMEKLIDDEELERTSLTDTKKVLRAWSSTPKLPSLEIAVDSESKSSELNVEAIFKLKAHESRLFQVTFAPTKEGHFQNKFSLVSMDDPDSVFEIHIEGAAEVPRLVVLQEVELLDFGPLLVLQENIKPHKKCMHLEFQNVSMVFATVKFYLRDGNYSCFDIEPQKKKLEPLEHGFITVTASTRELGPQTDVLILNVDHNDEPQAIQLVCTGAELDVDFEPKQEVNLERVLLHTTEKRSIKVHNKSAIALYWRMLIDSTEMQIRFVPSEGKIKAKDDCEIELQYHANEVLAPHLKFVSFEVYLNETDSEPIKVDALHVKAEVYEISLYVEAEDPIDFGAIPVQSTSEKSFVLKNLGHYNVKYQLQYQDIVELKKSVNEKILTDLQQNIEIHPISGLILPKKQTTIIVTFTPSIEMRINAIPLLKCIVSEPYKEYGDVNEHVLTVSAVSYYTRFLIEPHPKLDFGALELKATKTMQLKLTNTGQFPLKFSFVNRLANNFDDRSSVVTDRGKRSSKQRKISKRPSTLQNVSMKFGPFKLEKIKGALAPGEVDIVNVHCVSDTVGRFNETLSILVSDSLPANDENQLIHLTADVCVANLDLENLHEVFTSSHIVETLDDFSCPNEFGQYTVFEKTSKCLYFYNVCVGCNYTTEIKLRNSSAVNGTVLIEIPENSASNGTFRVDQSRFSIPSMSTRSFSIIFAPKFLGDSSNTLLIKLDLPESIKPKNFSIDLKGVGCVPQIRLIEPVVNGSDVPVINFGLTFVSATTIKVCKVKNVGLVSAEVSLQFFTNQDAAYKVVLNERDDKTVTDHSSSNLCFRILPEEVVDVRVAFLPTKSGKYEGRLQCSVQHNPYEVIEVNLVGEGFLRTIILENLELVDELSINCRKSASKNSRDSQKSRKVSLRTGSSMTKLESKSRDLSPLTYKLDYGNCFLNQIQKVAFRIVNKTLDRFFRFEWDSLACLICTPAAGHLGPNSFKELTATFLALEPTALNQIPLSCDINEIILVEPITEPLWDNRQMTVSWMEKYPSMSDLETYEDNEEDMYMKKMIKEIEEPLFDVVPETLETVRLLVSAIVNYSEYQCNINAIKFEDTLMFQTSQQTIELINVGKVDMNFSWDLVMDEQYPKRLNQIDSGLNFSLESFKKTSDRKRYTVKTTPISAHKKDLRFDCEDSTSSREKSDLFSSSAGITDRSTDSWIEGENWPFKIEPESGCIAPGNSIKCFLKFLPVDVFEYKACLQCKIENLHPSATPLVIAVAAKSLLPYCHFEIEESDYLTSSRRDMKLPIPSEYSLADPDVAKHIRIAEFNVLGIKECHILQICFVNPTTEDYSYRWSNVPHVLSKKLPEFRCLSETGTAEKGKRIRTEFSMVSENVGLFESLWQFEIKKYNLKTLFIVVVNVAEPSICCKNPILKFETSTIGQVITNSFEIVNNECCQLSFNIVKSSLYSEGRLQEISIFPISGELNPYATQLFNVKFKSRLIGEFTFNVQCQIEKLQKPINIFVSTQVIEISSQIAYTNWDDQELNMSENLDNIIEVEQLLLNVPTRIKFKISNTGGIAFDYMWQLNAADRNNFKVWFSESVGRVEKGCHNVCFLELIVTDKVVIRNYPVTIKLKNGPTYRIKLNASVKKLPLEFSFDEHDFGLCYIKKDKGFSHSKTLNITNNQKIPFSIQCDFVDTHNVKLDLCQLREAISPKSQIKIPIYFQPTEEMSYKEIVLFQVPNISLRKEIVIRGEGIPIQVHLKYPCDGILNFGSILVGNETTKKLSIVNSGRATVTLKVVVTECWAENIFSINTESRAKDERNSLTPTVSSKYSHTSSKDVNLLEFLEVAPNDWFDLKMNREQLISIKFQAMQRVRSCKIKLGLDMDNTIIPLTVVKAECIAMNLYLSRTNVSFGNIFETCVAEEKLTLMNDGDVDTRFYWRDITSDFEIHPQSGRCPAGRYVIFTCTFKPQCLGSCLQAEAVLELKDYKKLTINMIGNCCPLPEAKDTINFTAETNKPDKKDIIIENNSNETWSLTPKIEGKRFTVDAILHVNPKSSSVCTVTYNPEKQLSKEFYDEGKLIIVLPNGRPPIVYDLCGHISQVLPTKNMVRQLPAKKKFVETLTLHNGSETSRIFDCSTNELTENNVKKISSFKVEVPSRSQKEYKYPFYFETEGHYVYQITFDDHQNNRQCYKIEFTVTCPESQETIKMSTYVRSPTFHTLKIENSLEYRSVTFDANDIDDVVVHGLPMTLLPMEFRFVRVEYSPLLPCDKQETLIIKSEDQDEFSYFLHLMAKPAPPEKVTYVKSSLGRTTDFTLRAKNYSKVSCRFEITASHLAFTCPQFVDALENEEVLMNVRFEPYALETVDATIKMKSSIAGEFTYPVVGQCTPPQPEGPLAVSPNAPTSITFKNIFLEAKSFEISVDNSDFVLEDSKAQINSKESFDIRVRLRDDQSSDDTLAARTGKLIVTHSDLHWIYYLRSEC